MTETALIITAWLVGGLFVVGGFVCTFLPVVPGPLLIFLGAVCFELIAPGQTRIEIWGFLLLLFLFVLTQVLDFVSGAMGAKFFGSTKWGVLGAIVGGIIGSILAFTGVGIIALFILPIVGVFSFEMLFAKKEWKPATKSTWGTLVGATAGIFVKVAIALVMVAWFFIDVLFVGVVDTKPVPQQPPPAVAPGDVVPG